MTGLAGSKNRTDQPLDFLEVMCWVTDKARCFIGYRSGDMTSHSMWGTPTCWRWVLTAWAPCGCAFSSMIMKFGVYWRHRGVMMGWMTSCRYDWPVTFPLTNTRSVFLSINIPVHTVAPPPPALRFGAMSTAALRPPLRLQVHFRLSLQCRVILRSSVNITEDHWVVRP